MTVVVITIAVIELRKAMQCERCALASVQSIASMYSADGRTDTHTHRRPAEVHVVNPFVHFLDVEQRFKICFDGLQSQPWVARHQAYV